MSKYIQPWCPLLFLLILQTNKAGHFSINMQRMDTANPTRSAALDLLRLQNEVCNLSHTQQVMETTITSLDVAKHRLSVVLALHRKASELASEEQRLKASMDPTTASVLANKRLYLWKKLLATTGFADMQVVDMVTNGTPLYGSHTKPPNFPDDWKPSLISVDELLESSVWRRKSLMSTENSRIEDQVQDDLHVGPLAWTSL
jgi:hypothetical protein